MAMQPLCEPVELPLGRSALVARVETAADAPPPARLLHFHDVAEIVLFRSAAGRFHCDGASYPLSPGCAVFVPTMVYHDYHFDPGPKAWTLIQVEPYLVEQQARAGAAPNGPVCANPGAATAARLQMLADLLAETAQVDPADPLVERIIALILALISREPGLQGERAPGSGQQLARFLPAIARLRQAPGARLPLAEAARLCHLSPAYFSRRFADVFRCGFSDYVTSYKLHVAAREIATTSKPLGEIGFELGFASPSHFAARFHERFGLSPRAYRLRVQGQR